ncbi:MAG: hypothetical protein U0231_21025 [Nitrospiraceae bacterium]
MKRRGVQQQGEGRKIILSSALGSCLEGGIAKALFTLRGLGAGVWRFCRGLGVGL